MQQFRPLPRFNEIEEAELVESPPVTTPPVVTTDAFPAVFPGTTGHTPRVSVNTTGQTPRVSVNTTGHMPILLFTGPHPTPVTDQLAALAQKSSTTSAHPTLTAALQSTLGTNSSTSRLVVIPAGKKHKNTSKSTPVRHLKPRVRHLLVLFATLGILAGTLLTLVPLSSGQNGGSLLSNFGDWIHSAQMNSQIQSHMVAVQDINPNPANLPRLHIPNSPYVAIAEQDALNAGISPVYFVRQIDQESGFNTEAVSVTGALGIAQFEPYTASGLGINPLDPIQALKGAAQMMARYYHMYGDYAKALGAYNAGPGAVQGAVNGCGVNWLSCMPEQSQNYIYIIMGI